MTEDEFFREFPVQLNSQQRAAVRTVDGPVLLLAVPGSGKTTVLVARLGYMIFCCGIAPENILTVTYTVAATKDMKQRFAAFFGEELAERMEFRTINGICAKVIARYGRMIGKAPFELVTDEKKLLGVLSQIYTKQTGEYPSENDLKDVRTKIAYIKNMMLTENEILALDDNPESSAQYHDSRIREDRKLSYSAEAGRRQNGNDRYSMDQQGQVRMAEIYRMYEAYMKSNHLMDYDDQMKYALVMLCQKNSPILSELQDTYRYICVDEAQDTSKIQHRIMAILAGREDNLFMVGDEDQSIYGFRAAYPQALLDFEKDHPGAKVLLMEENFRSDANIVKAADHFIQANTLRHEKHMKASKHAGADIKTIPLKSRLAQYTYLKKVAADCTSQTAVLYRDNESIIPLVDLLERENIPYRIRSADLSFFTHRTVLDLKAILRLAVNPMDTECFLNVYYKLSSYLRKTEALEIAQISQERELTVWDAALRFGKLRPNVQKAVKSLQTHFTNMLSEDTSAALYRIVHFMGYGEYLVKNTISDSKIYILKALAGKEPDIENFLNRLDRLQNIIRDKKPDYDCPFILSTIHGSKGLEYDTVYLMDLQDGIFPTSVPDFTRGKNLTGTRSSRKNEWITGENSSGGKNTDRIAGENSSGGKNTDRIAGENPQQAELETYEEERRIFYVAVTRAKARLFLFTFREPSAFLNQFLDRENPQPAENKQSAASAFSTISAPVRKRKTSQALTTTYHAPNSSKASSPEFKAYKESFAEGLIVRHKIYGRGVVLRIEGTCLLVVFDDGTPKKLNLDICFLKKLLKPE